MIFVSSGRLHVDHLKVHKNLRLNGFGSSPPADASIFSVKLDVIINTRIAIYRSENALNAMPVSMSAHYF